MARPTSRPRVFRRCAERESVEQGESVGDLTALDIEALSDGPRVEEGERARSGGAASAADPTGAARAPQSQGRRLEAAGASDAARKIAADFGGRKGGDSGVAGAQEVAEAFGPREKRRKRIEGWPAMRNSKNNVAHNSVG
jgi:hypothetical protein